MKDTRSLWSRARPWVAVFDPTLSALLAAVAVVSLVTMYSAAYGFPGRFEGHLRNLLLATGALWFAANLRPPQMQRLALPLYVIGLLLLVAVALFGDVSKGARRWLNLGFGRVQPSEILKLAMPLVLAWFFQQREAVRGWREFALAAVVLLVPVALIARQPDLGTAILVLAAGAYVIFLAGLDLRILAALLAAGVAAAPLAWNHLHDYQRQRILTLLDPSSDPLGKGFHIIQSTIAMGSGGFFGRGWMQGTQTHLEFIPERTTDFVFAVYSEEFGMLGNLVLLTLYGAMVARGLLIAARASGEFSRLLAGSITLVFSTYCLVNMGMVSGVLPVVGVPLPFMSYGGTAMVTLALGMGLLMSINRHRALVQT